MHLLIKVVLLWLAIATTASEAQRQHWRIGGSGLAWSQGDSVQVLIDFSADAMQPVYIDPATESSTTAITQIFSVAY